MPKTVIITGGSGDIGAATVSLFAKKGYNTVIGYNNSEAKAKTLVDTLTEEGFNVSAFKADISDSSQAEKLIEFAVKTYGGIDILVNNAGIAEQKLFTDISNEDWNKMISVTLSGTFYCCRAATPYFVRQKRGSIVNVSSMWGTTGASCEVHYSAAKAGVIGLTKALAKELGPSNVRVNCIAPGVVDTEMNLNIDKNALNSIADETPLCRIGLPFEIAKAIYFLGNDGEFITGQTLGVNGGLVI